MKLDVGVAVTVFASDQNTANACPSREIAVILLVGILCVKLVGRNEQMVKIKRNFLTSLKKSQFFNHVEQQRVKFFCGVETIRNP